MKKIVTLLFLLIGLTTFAQSNLTIFNNGGQQFYVILNGIKQNSKPMTNVVVGGIKNGSYSVKLIFADGKTPDIDKNFFLEEPSDITTRVVFKKGKGKLQLIGMEPTKGASTQSDLISYRSDNNAVFSDAPVVQPVTTSPVSTTTGTTTSTTTQSTTVTDPTNQNGNVGMNININVNDPSTGGQNMNMSVNMNGTGTGTTTQTSQSTQTTTISQSSTVTSSGNQGMNNTTQTSTNGTPSQIMCKNVLGDADKMAADLKALMMDEDRVKAIKLDLEKYCLTAAQAYKLVETLSFDEDALEASKFLYDRMIDKDKASVLFPLFKFDDTKIAFRQYMNSKK